jgi:hypothetical protein
VAVELLGGEVGEWLCLGIILFAEGASGGGESQRMVRLQLKWDVCS